MKRDALSHRKGNSLVLAVSCTIVYSAAALTGAWILGNVVDHPEKIMLRLLGLLCALGVQMLTKYGESILFNRFAANMLTHMRGQVGKTLVYLSQGTANEQKTGDILTRINADIDAVYEFLRSDFREYISGGLSFVLGMSYIGFLSWKLSIFIVVMSTLIVAAIMIMNHKIAKAHRAWKETESEMSVALEDIAQGQLDIKAMGIEEGVLHLFTKSLDKWRVTFCNRNKVRASNRLYATLFSVLIIVGIPSFCARYVMNGEMTVGTVLAAIQAAGIFAEPLQKFEYYATTFTSNRINVQRVMRLIGMKHERSDGHTYALQEHEPLIRMENVDFSYGEKEVLKNFSLTLEKGRTIALVGASGSGKSTILQLLAGLYDAKHGEIKVGGYPIESWKLSSLRSHIGYVQQQTYVFPGTLRENLTCGEPYTDAQLMEIIHSVHLDEWLALQTGGLDMVIGENGANLSGGIRQRITIARILLRNPSILMLDEPTSALDEKTEIDVMQTLREAAEGRACLIVAHRLSTIKDADVIIAMRDGRIVEMGTHTELMAAKGYYNTLYSKQKEGMYA